MGYPPKPRGAADRRGEPGGKIHLSIRKEREDIAISRVARERRGSGVQRAKEFVKSIIDDTRLAEVEAVDACVRIDSNTHHILDIDTFKARCEESGTRHLVNGNIDLVRVRKRTTSF